MKRIMIAAIVLAAAACTPKSGQGPSGQEKAAEGAWPPRATSRLPERYTIVTQQSGAATGATTQYVRDGGRRMAMIQETTMVVMGVTQRTRMRMIAEPADGDVLRTVTIDLETGQAISSTMAMQDMPQVNSAIVGMSKQAFSGGRRTGEKGSFAGHECQYWENSDSTMRMCIGSLGLPLYTRMQMAGMTMENTVTELRLGDGGPDSAFAYDASRVVEAQTSQDVMDAMMGR